jgi:hypothetical protein
MPLHLIIMDKVVLLGVIFKKWSVSVRHKWCPRDHKKYKQVKSSLTLCMMFYVASKKEMKSNYLSFCEYLTNPPPDFSSRGHKKSPTTCHYQIFEENQNPVDMHTSIMCINIILNIKAVAPKL